MFGCNENMSKLSIQEVKPVEKGSGLCTVIRDEPRFLPGVWRFLRIGGRVVSKKWIRMVKE